VAASARPSLRAGISTFDLSRYMAASLTMIDRHSGHLARDGREHAIQTARHPPRRRCGRSWTLGGRRSDHISPEQTTGRLAQQAITEALWRTRTADPLLTMEVLYRLS
jgi:hypothetical protein